MISIITPVINGSKYIEDNIKSIMALSIDYEHIIVDGGSTDHTIQIINKYPHIKLLKQTDSLGMYSAIHQGFIASKYEYITWLNCDDKLISENFVRAIEKIQSENCNFLFGGSYYYNMGNKINVLHYPPIFPFFFLKNGLMPFTQPATIYTKELYNLSGGLNYNSFKLLGDLDLFQRMAVQKEFKAIRMNSPLTIFINRSDSLLHSSSKEKVMLEESKLYKKSNFVIKQFFRVFLFAYYFRYLKAIINK